MLTSVLLLFGVGIMMFTISPLLALVALTTVPLSIWSLRFIPARALANHGWIAPFLIQRSGAVYHAATFDVRWASFLMPSSS
jgi:ABC-type multidrug transport system fused ATPase/permease subunit